MSERLEDLKDQSKTNELLKRYCDVQVDTCKNRNF